MKKKTIQRTQLYIWQKLWALGLLFLLFFAVPTGFYLREVIGTLDRTTLELQGVEQSGAATAAARALALHRTYAAATLSGGKAASTLREEARAAVDEAVHRLESALAGDARTLAAAREATQAWTGLAQAVSQGFLSPTESYNRHGEVIAQVLALRESLLEQRRLSYDSDPRVSHGVSIAFVHAPNLVEAMSQAEATAAALLAARESTAEQRNALAAQLEKVKERMAPLRARVRKAIESDEGLKARLEAVQGDTEAQVADFLRTARVDVVFNPALDRDLAAHLKAQRLALSGAEALAVGAVREAERILGERAHDERVRLAAIAVLIAVAVVIALGFGIWTGRSIARPLGHAVRVADGIAAGHLDHPIDPGRARNAEAARLMRAFASMQQGLSTLASELQGSGHEIHRAAAQVARGNADLAARTEHQASSLEETAATMEELTAAVRRNAENAAEASTAVDAAHQAATRGGTAVGGVIETMGTIQDAARRIGDIIGVIDGIAFQTNILALNAAVEAARAGEQGRGFAVVASEVRSLAQRSAEAAREVKALVQASNAAVDSGSRRVEQAGTAMREIGESVQRVAALFTEIATASAEQGHGIEQVNRAVGEMERATQQNASLVGEAAASSEALQGEARRLAELVARFRLADAVPAPRAAGARPGGEGEILPVEVPLLQGAE